MRIIDYHDNIQEQETLFSSKREEAVVFFFVTVGIFALTCGFFAVIDFLPEDKKSPVVDTQVLIAESVVPEVTEGNEAASQEVIQVAALPLSITFDSMNGKEVKVLNPEQSTIEALDTALLEGVVRHPDSADFEQTGTILIMGHSSYLPNVMNENFQAFNGIQKLTWGDTIRLKSADTEYTYSVDRVYQAKATDAEISLGKGESKLILATCNSFGTKDDRFVVEALLVNQKSL